MKLTEQIIHSAGTNGIGFNFHQLYVLGVKWPPRHGWIRDLVGKDVPQDVWNLVLSMRGRSRNERRAMLKNTPFNKEIFIRKSDLKIRIGDLEEALKMIRDGLEENLCCEPDGSPDQSFHYCDDCVVKLNLISVADQALGL